MSADGPEELAAALANASLKSAPAARTSHTLQASPLPKHTDALADSWEEAPSSSDEDNEDEVVSSTHVSPSHTRNATPVPTTPRPSSRATIPISSPLATPQPYNVAPPPTPSTPDLPPAPPPSRMAAVSPVTDMSPGARPSSSRADRRPEKTSAPAARMIAHALGVRPQTRSKEEKEYDRAVREKELKRKIEEREQAKRAEELREKAKRDIWDE